MTQEGHLYSLYTTKYVVTEIVTCVVCVSEAVSCYVARVDLEPAIPSCFTA